MKRALVEATRCMVGAVRHPKTPIKLNNPGRDISPIPWWGSGVILVMGIVTWILSHVLGVAGLEEAGRAMVYLPLGNIFGMTVKLRSTE